MSNELHRIIFALYFLCTLFNGQAQNVDHNLQYKDYIYLPHVRTVTFNPTNNPLSFPIITLNTQGQLNIDTLALGFDDLSGDINRYVYTVQLCDKNWEPADVAVGQYLEGFENEPINEYYTSSGAITPYLHFNLQIPNKDFSLKLSGNYLLKVYEDEDEKRLAFTKRFMVIQPQYKIEGKFVPTFDIEKRETHHEIDFEMQHLNQRINNGTVTISATILQNDRWDTAIENLPPSLLKTERMIFDYSDKIVFEALRDFRQFDNRSFNDRSIEVQDVEIFSDGILVKTKSTEKRSFTVYNYRRDLNGKFVIQNRDEFQEANDPKLENLDPDFLEIGFLQPFDFSNSINTIMGDYSINQFYLNYPEEIENASVYIYGGLNDYNLNEEYKMKYNSEKSRYEGSCLLKQGFYEYYYAVVPDNTQKISLEEMEGSIFQTENQYTILIYYRPFGSQHDQLVARDIMYSGIVR